MTKMTNVMALTFVLDNCDVPSDVREKLEKMKGTFESKSQNAKPTENQVENENFKTLIRDFLSDGRKATVSEMIEGINFGCIVSNQRISAVIRAMRLAGEVAKEEIKHKSYFSLV